MTADDEPGKVMRKNRKQTRALPLSVVLPLMATRRAAIIVAREQLNRSGAPIKWANRVHKCAIVGPPASGAHKLNWRELVGCGQIAGSPDNDAGWRAGQGLQLVGKAASSRA